MSETPDRFSQALKEILSGGFTRTVLSIILGFLVGALVMIGSDTDFIESLGYFFSRPGDAIGAAFSVVTEGYGALFRGSIFNGDAETFEKAIRPLTETLRLAAPLILAGLGIGLTFRVGMFNIGGTGQIISGMIWATFVATRLELPFVIHTVVAVLAGVIGAALLGALTGFLKARTGAHEVILTIMFNYIMFNLFNFLLKDADLLGEEASTGNAISDPAAASAVLP